jgi:hypothetical protein
MRTRYLFLEAHTVDENAKSSSIKTLSHFDGCLISDNERTLAILSFTRTRSSSVSGAHNSSKKDLVFSDTPASRLHLKSSSMSCLCMLFSRGSMCKGTAIAVVGGDSKKEEDYLIVYTGYSRNRCNDC